MDESARKKEHLCTQKFLSKNSLAKDREGEYFLLKEILAFDSNKLNLIPGSFKEDLNFLEAP